MNLRTILARAAEPTAPANDEPAAGRAAPAATLSDLEVAFNRARARVVDAEAELAKRQGEMEHAEERLARRVADMGLRQHKIEKIR